jgi:hypothetical protein
MIADISILLSHKKSPVRKVAVCAASDCSTDWMKNVYNETVTMNGGTRKDILDGGIEKYF